MDSAKKPITIKEALKQIGKEVEYGTEINGENVVGFIKSMDGLESNLSTTKLLEQYDKSDLAKGYWIKTIYHPKSRSKFTGELDQAIEENDVLVILNYMHGKEILSKKSNFKQVYKSKNYEAYDFADQLLDFNPIIGDSIVLTIVPKIERFKTEINSKILFSCFNYSGNETVAFNRPFQDCISSFEPLRNIIHMEYFLKINQSKYYLNYDNNFKMYSHIDNYSIIYTNSFSDGDPITLCFGHTENILPIEVWTGFVNSSAIYNDPDLKGWICSEAEQFKALSKNPLTPKLFYPRIKFDFIVEVFRGEN